jgi:hypothetical protein
MHGMDMDDVYRYDGEAEPPCETCHEDQIGVGSGIYQHEVHGTETLSCQTCHSVSYTNCTNCHVERTEDDIAFYSVESHEVTFVIGRNPLRSAERPYDYTVLRHVPVDPESFSFYDIEMALFSSRPTWVYATPHNIQRNTPQTESCESCHGNDDIFLTPDRVVEWELEANADVMVDAAPPLPEGYTNVITGQEDAQPPADTGGSDDFWGSGGETAAPTESAGDFWGSDDTAQPTEAPDDFWGGGGDTAAPTESPDDFWGGGGSTPEPTESADDFWGSP